MLACRPEASLLYLNADDVLGRMPTELDSASGGSIQTVICDLSASPTMDLAGVRMLAALQEELGRRGVDLVVTNAHGRVRDLMRAEGRTRGSEASLAVTFWKASSPALWDRARLPDCFNAGRDGRYCHSSVSRCAKRGLAQVHLALGATRFGLSGSARCDAFC